MDQFRLLAQFLQLMRMLEQRVDPVTNLINRRDIARYQNQHTLRGEFLRI